MGCIFSPRDAVTAGIDREMRNNANKDQMTINLLFLGAGGSGKSTLFKQLRLLYGDGLAEDVRRGYTGNIYSNIITGIKTLVEGNQELANDDYKEDEDQYSSKGKRKVRIIPCDGKIAELVEDISEDDFFSPETAKVVKMAWADKGIQSTWANRTLLQVQDSLAYYIENAARISQPNYIPSKDDVLHVRAQTTGIVEEDMKINNRMFHIVDVGGQRSERRKWINCFEDVRGLIFVVSLIAYNQVLYEDEETNRMVESLNLFKETLTGKRGLNFKNTCLVIFFNKNDLFHEMIKDFPITTCFPKYKGELTEDAQYEYIRQLYQAQVPNRTMFFHRTCATNTNQIEVIFSAVNLTIIKRALGDAGLLM